MLHPCSFDGGESHHPVDPALLPAGPCNAISNELIIVSLIKWVFDWGKQFDDQRGDKEKQAKHLTWKPSNLHLHLERRETHTGWAPQELCSPLGLVWLRARFTYKLCRPSLAQYRAQNGSCVLVFCHGNKSLCNLIVIHLTSMEELGGICAGMYLHLQL